MMNRMKLVAKVRGYIARSMPLPAEDGSRVLILWWGSLPLPGATVGDYMAVCNVALALADRGLSVEIAAFAPMPIGHLATVHPDAANPKRYRTVCFVCGPLRGSPKLLKLMHRYRNCNRVAAGVSVIQSERDIVSCFDSIIPRDGRGDAAFDLALADPWAASFSDMVSQPEHIATCFRGRQSRIGLEGVSHHDLAERLLFGAAQQQSRDKPIVRIDTLASNPAAVGPVLDQFRRAKMVFTTRLHGSLLALHFSVPFVAVDQIGGGHKVKHVLSILGWPLVYDVADLSAAELANAAVVASAPAFAENVRRLRTRAIELSNSALARTCDTIAATH